jgi:hypothetical protein
MTEQPVDPPHPKTMTVEDLQRLLDLVAAHPWGFEPEIVSPEEYRRRAADPLWTGEASA